MTCQNHTVPFQMFKRDLDLEHEYNSNTSTAVIFIHPMPGAKLIVQAGASCQGLRKMPTESHVYSRPCLTWGWWRFASIIMLFLISFHLCIYSIQFLSLSIFSRLRCDLADRLLPPAPRGLRRRAQLGGCLLWGWIQKHFKAKKIGETKRIIALMVWDWWFELCSQGLDDVGISCWIGFRCPFYWHWQSTFQTQRQSQSHPLSNFKLQFGFKKQQIQAGSFQGEQILMIWWWFDDGLMMVWWWFDDGLMSSKLIHDSVMCVIRSKQSFWLVRLRRCSLSSGRSREIRDGVQVGSMYGQSIWIDIKTH